MIIFDNPATVSAPAGQYSHVARVELGSKTILQLSGQVAIDAERKIVGNDMTTQASSCRAGLAGIKSLTGSLALLDEVVLRDPTPRRLFAASETAWSRGLCG